MRRRVESETAHRTLNPEARRGARRKRPESNASDATTSSASDALVALQPLACHVPDVRAHRRAMLPRCA
eukprot:10081442-Alexandrium_andersonii.AAC.1